MKRASIVLIAAVLAAGLVGGCEKKFTMKRFDTMIHTGQTKMEVEKILGAPDARWETVWKYVDWEEDGSAKIVFDENGRVVGKGWSDLQRQDPDPEIDRLDKDWPDGEDASSSGGSSTTTEVVVP